jgi:hypothetical protein
MEDLTLNNQQIAFQKTRVFDKHPEVKLIEPCKIGDGIVHFLLVQRENLIQKFTNAGASSTFFIPASGSGSRMFQFLYDFLEQPNEDNRGQVERFLNNMEEFAFFQKLPIDIKKNLKSHNVNLDEFVAFLLNAEGMAYGELPKGLIPFHKNGPFVLNPFQEQILQGIKVNEENAKFHYTINPAHQESISHNIKSTEELSGRKYDVSYSIQNQSTDAIAFDRDKNALILEDGSILKRPAGHGALLENLNKINTDIIFIKNIDNLQHYQKSKEAIETWKYLGGVALWFREEQLRILKNPNLEDLLELNRVFQFLSKQEIENIETNEQVITVLNRPIRVCGMVRNEGQPGGGPFWIEDQGKITKQIVEKSQITMSGDQYRLMVQSVYFNPVMIACINKDINNEPFDLMKYRDESKFFVVSKKQKGQDILFSELPGLWNGSMAHWNSIFVEVKSDTFSPVKTILDLLEAAHLEA